MTLWILPSDRVTILNDDKDLFEKGANKIYYVYNSPEGEVYTFHNEEILHVKSSSTVDGYTGVSVRERLATTIDGNVNAQTMLNGMYKSGYTAKAVLEYTGDLSDANVKKYVKGIERYAKGTNTDDLSAIIPIPVGSKLTPLNISLADGQFIEIKKYSALQIASAFGIKPNQIGDYEKSSYASAEAQQLSFYVDTLLFIVKQYEEELSFKLLSFDELRKGFRFKFNVDVILRADFKTKVETLSKAVNTFLFTPNEAREKLDLEAMEGGDSLMGNGSTVKLEQIGIQYNAQPSGDPEPQTSTDSVGEGGETDGEGTEGSDAGAGSPA
jgi:HK97 family phage portal protein